MRNPAVDDGKGATIPRGASSERNGSHEPMLDGWSEVFEVAGSRTTGGKAQTYAITGPGWSGTLPPGVQEVKSPTGMVWILGRIYSTGTPDDYKAVHALQDRFSVVPLSAYGKPYAPPPGVVDPRFDMKAAVRKQVNAMDVVSYFNRLAQLMKTNPPTAQDAPKGTPPSILDGSWTPPAAKKVQ
jgi:hypothetical protein